MVFPENGELESLSGPGFDVFTFSVRSERLDEIADSLELGPVDELANGAEVIELGSAAMAELRCRASEICGSVAAEPSLASVMRAATETGIEMPRCLLMTMAAARGIEDRRSARRRESAISRALDHLARRVSEPVSVNELCRAAGVSARTLRRAFLERFGKPPKAYLRKLRLNAAHEELRAASSTGVTIHEVANRWGFWHMG